MKKTIFCIAAFVAMLMTPAAHVFASELNFAAKAQMPDNQVNKGVSYFDIKMDQGAKQALHVDLRNDTEKEVAVDVALPVQRRILTAWLNTVKMPSSQRKALPLT